MTGDERSVAQGFTLAPLSPVLAETAAWLVDRVIPRVPVRHWVLSFLIPLRGLGTSGQGGSNEPSFQQLMDLFRIPIQVGDSTPLETNLNDPPSTPNDDAVLQQFIKFAAQ